MMTVTSHTLMRPSFLTQCKSMYVRLPGRNNRPYINTSKSTLPIRGEDDRGYF